MPLHQFYGNARISGESGFIHGYLYSTNSKDGAGLRNEGDIGYIYTTGAPDRSPLYHLAKIRTARMGPSPITTKFISDNFYTTDAGERDHAIQNYGFTDLGITGFAYTFGQKPDCDPRYYAPPPPNINNTVCIGEYNSPQSVPKPSTVQGIPIDQYSGSTCSDHRASFVKCSDAHGTPKIEEVVKKFCRRAGTWTQAYPPAKGGHCGFGWYEIVCQ